MISISLYFIIYSYCLIFVMFFFYKKIMFLLIKWLERIRSEIIVIDSFESNHRKLDELFDRTNISRLVNLLRILEDLARFMSHYFMALFIIILFIFMMITFYIECYCKFGWFHLIHFCNHLVLVDHVLKVFQSNWTVIALKHIQNPEQNWKYGNGWFKQHSHKHKYKGKSR